MAKKPEKRKPTAKRRRREASKNVANSVAAAGGVPPLAIEITLEFLKPAIAQERLALAALKVEDGVADDGHTETIIVGEIAALETVDQFRRLLSTEPPKCKEFASFLAKRVDLLADTIVRSIPGEVHQERQEQRFIALHRSLAGWTKIPLPLENVEDWKALDRARRAKEEELQELLDQRERLTPCERWIRVKTWPTGSRFSTPAPTADVIPFVRVGQG